MNFLFIFFINFIYIFSYQYFINGKKYNLKKHLVFLKKSILIKIENKKIKSDLSKLVDFIKSYLQAGLVPQQAILNAIRQRKWSTAIQTPLVQIIYMYENGKPFHECLEKSILETKNQERLKYLHILLFSIYLGIGSGGNIIKMIDKIKLKIEKNINFERKLKAITSQIRLQSTVIVFSPLFLFIIVYMISPEYILFFFNQKVGNIIFLCMILTNITGALFLKKILEIK